MADEMSNLDFWLEIRISPRALKTVTSAQIGRLVRDVFPLIDSGGDVISKFFGVTKISQDKDEIKKILSLNEKTKELIGLASYLRDKIDLLKEFFQLIDLKDKYIRAPLLGLIFLYLESRDKIIESFYYALFKQTFLLETWYSDKDPSESLRATLIDQKAFHTYTKKFKLGKTKFLREIRLSQSNIFCFERAKKEDVDIGYGERKEIRRRGIYFVEYNSKDSCIRLKTKDKRVPILFSKLLEDKGIKVYLKENKLAGMGTKEVINKIIANDATKLKITQISFNALEQGINSKVDFTDRFGIELAKSMRIMDGDDLIPRDINKLRSFKIDLGGLSRSIYIDKTVEGRVYFVMNDKNLTKEKQEELTKVLNEELGVELNTPYENYQKSLTPSEIFTNIIGKLPNELTKAEQEVYKFAQEQNLLSSLSKPLFICSANRQHITDFYTKSCKECGAEMQELSRRETLQLNQIGLLDYIVKKLNRAFPDYAIKTGRLKVLKKEISFIHLNHPQSEFYICLIDRVKAVRNKLNDRLIPIIRLVLDKNSKIDTDRTTYDLYAYDLAFESDENLREEIKNKVINKFASDLNAMSQDSYNKLSEIAKGLIISTGDEFEDFCYPLIKSIFYGATKYGRKNKGVRIPDGMYGAKLEGESTGFSLIYDCKYSEKEYSLDIDEKRKAEEYIRRANQAEAIRKFSKKLSCYMVIGKGIQSNKFNSFADDLQKYKKWNGKIVLLDLDNLLYLFKKLKDDIPIDTDNALRFNVGQEFTKFIKNATKRVIIFESSNIDQIVESAKNSTTKINQIEFLSHMKAGIER